MLRYGLVVVTALWSAPVAAQHVHQEARDTTRSAYAAWADREIKALAADEIAALLAGDGMGLALAAELNGYPGPQHVLELAHELNLEHDVVERIQHVRDAMLAHATALGARIVEGERALDQAFRAGALNDSTLKAATQEIGRLQGALRFAHLRAHLAVTTLLSREQIDLYQQLRGYRSRH